MKLLHHILHGLAALALGASILTPPAAQAAGLLIADGGLGGVLEIQEHNVQVTIHDGVAVTTVTQVFHNTEKRQIEALYTFPVPRGASVSGFSMWINGKEMVGEVLEKKHAREIYDSYRRVNRDPGLLEQTDFRTFEMRVFPIAAGADQKVQLTWYQELDVDHDWATYVYPLATNSRGKVDSRDDRPLRHQLRRAISDPDRRAGKPEPWRQHGHRSARGGVLPGESRKQGAGAWPKTSSWPAISSVQRRASTF